MVEIRDITAKTQKVLHALVLDHNYTFSSTKTISRERKKNPTTYLQGSQATAFDSHMVSILSCHAVA